MISSLISIAYCKIYKIQVTREEENQLQFSHSEIDTKCAISAHLSLLCIFMLIMSYTCSLKNLSQNSMSINMNIVFNMYVVFC